MCAVRLIFLKKYKKTIDILLLFCYYIQALSERHSSLAQSVEHSAVNRVVVGSSPTGGATNKKTGHRPVFLFVLFSFFALHNALRCCRLLLVVTDNKSYN